MIIVGLVGRIGAGKSTVARAMADLGAEVIDADRIAHAVLAEPEVVAAVPARFGADVLDVVKGLGPRRIIDAATLTGACMVALGYDVAGLFTNDQPLCDALAAAARSVGEPVWQLPMYAEYDDQIKSEVADIKNVGEGRWGGAITAAKFLERFVGGIPWTHVDIAGPAFAEKPRPWIDGGGTGSMVRAFVEFARGT